MTRNQFALFILSLCSAATVHGLGLGPLETYSGLNEPFVARITLADAKNADFDTLEVKLGDPEQFDRAGIRRTVDALNLRFTLVRPERAAPYISVTTSDSVKEPFLNFLVNVDWASGRLVREYTVLLDPPLYDPNRGMPAPAAASPAAAPSAGAAAMSGGSYGPVASGETLWTIASSIRSDESVSVQQMMMALLRANPEAFIDGNINALKRGAVLRVPDYAEISSLSRQQALAEVRAQHESWQGYVAQAPSRPAEEPLGFDSADDAEMESGPAAADDARLSIVAPGEGEGAGTGTSATGGASLYREEIEALKQENQDLSDKLAEADEIIDLLQRQVDIKDNELTALQRQLAADGVEVEETAEPEAMAPEEAVEPEEDIVEAMDEPMDEAPMVDEGMDEAVVDEEPMVEEPAVEEAPPAETAPPVAAVPAPEPAAGGIMEKIEALVPGGLKTALGALAAIVLLLVALVLKAVRGRGKDAGEAAEAAPAVAAVDDFVDEVEVDEPITESQEPESEETASPVLDDSDATELAFDEEDETDFGDGTLDLSRAETLDEDDTDLNATLETSADAIAPEAPAEAAEDPLEEVNVYLAYERFDQAEELVRKAIADYPDEHEYKLRLLEVFYSANDTAKYELAALELNKAVGEDSPLWASALAMWQEMSPERELFDDGAGTLTSLPGAASATFDITTPEEDRTESTQVGLGAAAEAGDEEDGGVDFDLTPGDSDDSVLDITSDAGGAGAGDDILDLTATGTGAGAESDADEGLDFTATEDDDTVLDITGENAGDEQTLNITADDDDVLDMTGTAGGAADDDMLDITSTAGGAADDDMLDITSTAGGAADDELLDITGGDAADDEFLDITAGSDSGDDLLDVTKTGDMTPGDNEDILNVTAPGGGTAGEDLLDLNEPVEDTDGVMDSMFETDDLLDVSQPPSSDSEPDDEIEVGGTDGSETLDFDLGETGDLGAMMDETKAGGDAADDDMGLDFDIGDLEDDGESADDSFDLSLEKTGNLHEVGGDAADDDDLDLTIDESAASTEDTEDKGTEGLEDTVDDSAGEFSLQGDELDELVGEATDDLEKLTSQDVVDDDDSLDFDLSLEDTSELNDLAIEETLEMPQVGGDVISLDLDSDDESLEDLTKSMEDTVAGLDDEDEPALDISMDLGMQDETDKLDDDADRIETVRMSADDDDEDTQNLGMDTVALPRDEAEDLQSDVDETDTKLNLAKAYIELGDKDGARSILDEVVAEGTTEQKQEAESLMDGL